MQIGRRKNQKGDKYLYFYDYGRGKGQRPSAGIFTYVRPKNEMQKQHNVDTQALLSVKEGQAVIEQQAIGTPFVPQHKYKVNFLEFYQEYVDNHQTPGNRHLKNSLTQFKKFIGKQFVPPIEITEDLAKKFRKFLRARFNGSTPMDYFARFKQVIKSATKTGYFLREPTEDVAAQPNPSPELKEFLEREEVIHLLQTYCLNQQVQLGFVLTLYTGLRWCDIKALYWKQINERKLNTRIIQKKTGLEVTLFLHPVAKAILDYMRPAGNPALYPNQKVFNLPTQDGCNKILKDWVHRAGIDKHITWSCGRLTFSILLRDKSIDDVTVSLLLGHTTADQVNRVYRRHRPKDQTDSLNSLPNPENLPSFLEM